ncbi:MAG: P-loop NTPase fold protein [Rhodospirillaceae bacterium]|nr:P-loop NTPase fold protein [Rhodospirillaceae bacterium]
MPPDTPFENDLLERRPAIENLTELLGTTDGPCVVAVDSEWGGGKTTFLKIWAAHLRMEQFAVAEFNAWETDFSGDPFVALSSQLEDHFKTRKGTSNRNKKDRFSNAAKKVAVRAAPAVIRVISSGIVDVGNIGEKIGQEIASHAENRITEYQDTLRSIEHFRKILEEEAVALSRKHGDRPLFIMIDELDRCRPSYAIELLEVAKHLFSANKIVFVLAINRMELEKSVRALYGSDFDANGYLYRFFDLDYILPKPDRQNFVLEGFHANNLEAHFAEKSGFLQDMPNLIVLLLAKSHLDLRRIGQLLHRLALIVASKDQPEALPSATTGITLIFRSLNLELYEQFRNGEGSDLDIANRIYSFGELIELKNTPEGVLLEAMITISRIELSKKGVDWGYLDQSPLLSRHIATKEQIDSEAEKARNSGMMYRPDHDDVFRYNWATAAVSMTQDMARQYNGVMGFKAAIQRVELLPEKL